jgi:hypothetical protein
VSEVEPADGRAGAAEPVQMTAEGATRLCGKLWDPRHRRIPELAERLSGGVAREIRETPASRAGIAAISTVEGQRPTAIDASSGPPPHSILGAVAAGRRTRARGTRIVAADALVAGLGPADRRLAPAARSATTVHEATWVGLARSRSRVMMPLPASTRATSSAKTSEAKRQS